MPKALLLVQGINSKNKYLLNDLNKSGYKPDDYNLIEEVDTESEFDKAWFNRIPVLGQGFVAQYLGDVWQFYSKLHTKKRQDVCRKVRERIFQLQDTGYQVDIISHSLGTVIALCCGSEARPVKIDTHVILGSPIGIGFWGLRLKTMSHARKFSKNFKAKKIKYIWSRNDFVSKVFNAETEELISLRATRAIFHNSLTSHDSEEYLTFLKTYKL